MSVKKVILVDLDSTINNFVQQCLFFYEQEENVTIPLEMVKDYYFRFPNGKLISTYCEKKDFFRDLKPLPNAVETLLEWHQQGHLILIVSSSTQLFGPAQKYEWLSKHMPWLDRNQVIFTAAKEYILGDYMIDDCPINVEKHREMAKQRCIRNTTTYMTLAYAYNNLPIYDIRASDWSEIRSFFNSRETI